MYVKMHTNHIIYQRKSFHAIEVALRAFSTSWIVARCKRLLVQLILLGRTPKEAITPPKQQYESIYL
jgi:hypothetical protein